MKCPSKKYLYLYYYKDIDEKMMLIMEQHLKECLLCSKEYAKITNFLLGFKKEEINIEESELLSIVNRVKSKAIGRLGLKERLKEKVKFFIDGLKWSFVYHPRYAVAVIGIFIIAIGLPIRNKIVFESEMAEMELELVLDLDAFEDDIFLDFYNS